jgi:predicted small secreted protein
MVPSLETSSETKITNMKLIALIIAAFSALFLSACNTMEGLGRDMQKAGSSMERSASR